MTALNTQATRRAIFGTIGLGVAAVTVSAANPVAAFTAPAPVACISPELTRLILEADRTDAAVERFNKEVYEPRAPHVPRIARLSRIFGTRAGTSTDKGRSSTAPTSPV